MLWSRLKEYLHEGWRSENEDPVADLRFIIKLMQFHWMWPTTSEMNVNTRRYHIKLMVLMGGLIFAICGAALHIYHWNKVLKDYDWGADLSVLATISVIAGVWLTLMKSDSRKDYALHYLNHLYAWEAPGHILNTVAQLRRVYFLAYQSIVVGIVTYGVFEIRYSCLEGAEQKGAICGLYAPFWAPFNVDFFPVKQLISLVQFYAAIMGITGAALMSMYGFAFNVHMVICLRHVGDMAKKIGVTQRANAKKLRRLVHYHQQLIKLVERMNQVGAVPMCTHLFLTSTVLGILINQVIHSDLAVIVGPLITLVCWSSSLFLNSLGGQLLMDESVLVATKLYMNIKWHEMKTSQQRDVLFIICRFQKPFLVRTGSMGYMSFTVFITVIKGLYYIILLNIRRTFDGQASQLHKIR